MTHNHVSGAGVFLIGNASIDNKIRVSSMPYGYDISEGNVPNHQSLTKMGYNGDIDNLEEELWVVGGNYVFPASAQQMEVVSSSNDDSGNSTGAWTVVIKYLDASFNEFSETVTLKGKTPVATTATNIYRVNNFRILTAGTGGKAAGDIDIRNVADTPIYSRIPAGLTRARNAIYTVPNNKTLYISQITYSMGSSSGNVFAKFSLRANYDDLNDLKSTIFYPYSEIGVQDGAFTITYVLPMKFPEGVDIKVSCVGDANNANGSATVQYRGWLES